MQAKVGQRIKVVALSPDLDGQPDEMEPMYRNRTGRVRYIDGAGNLHCDWEDDIQSSLAILPSDLYIILGD